MLRPGIVGMRGSMVIKLRPCMRSSTSLLSSTPPPMTCDHTCNVHTRYLVGLIPGTWCSSTRCTPVISVIPGACLVLVCTHPETNLPLSSLLYTRAYDTTEYILIARTTPGVVNRKPKLVFLGRFIYSIFPDQKKTSFFICLLAKQPPKPAFTFSYFSRILRFRFAQKKKTETDRFFSENPEKPTEPFLVFGSQP